MSDAESPVPRAQALGSDDPGGWVFVGLASTLGPPVPIRAIHNWFFCGHPISEESLPLRLGRGPHPPIRLLKNVYNLTPVFTCGAGIVVNEAVRADLARLCTCEFTEVILARTFWYPYAAGDTSYEMAGIVLAGGEDQVLARFASAYRCEPPRERYFRVITHTGYLSRQDYADIVELHVGYDQSTASGAYGRDVYVSRSLLEQHGMAYSRGYVCRSDVFSALNPYLHRPWFWAQRYAFP